MVIYKNFEKYLMIIIDDISKERKLTEPLEGKKLML